MSKLQNFLNTHRSNGGCFTNTSMSGGSYFIDKDIEDFFILYLNEINSGKELCLTEKHLEKSGPIVIDLDFRFEEKTKTRQINKKVIKKFVTHLTNILIEMFGQDKNYDCFVLQRPEQYQKNNKHWADGLHIQYPYINCRYEIQHAIRNKFIKTFKLKKLNLDCANKIEDIYDKCVISRNNWCMYMSTKQNIKPYELKYVFGGSIEQKSIKFDTLDLIKILSIRHNNTKSIEPKNNSSIFTFVETTETIIKKQQIKITEKAKVLRIDPNQEYVEQQIRTLLNMLNKNRVEEYQKWSQIIYILHYCSLTDKNKEIDYKSIAHEWSKKCPEKYNEADLNKLWANLSTRNSELISAIGSLHFNAKKDNPKKYEKFRIELYTRTKINKGFPNNDFIIGDITRNESTCIIELDDDYCPFSNCKHDRKSLYFEITDKESYLKCSKCKLSKTKIDLTLDEILGPDIKKYKHSDGILLKDLHKHNNIKIISEKNRYISAKSIEELKKYYTILIHSPTGSGKTKSLRMILRKLDPNAKILSIISRRTMSDLHKTAFQFVIQNKTEYMATMNKPKRKSKSGSKYRKSKTTKPIKPKTLKMTSYLDEVNEIDKEKFIVSLEQLTKANVEYDILILDEVTSLLLQFYSSTMNGNNIRLSSFVKFSDLMKNCRTVIALDAIMTDFTIDFLMEYRDPENTVYYRNTFKNKKGIKLKIYFRTNNTINKEIEIFCKSIIDQVKNSQSIMVMTDSKKIAENVYNHLLPYNEDKSYFKLYTKDVGKIEEINNCNNAWKNKICIFSPKIIYGIDCLINYSCVYSIFSGSTLNSFSMLQQMSRARNTKKVKMLFLQKNYSESTNKYITYEENRRIENLQLNKFNKFINQKFEEDFIKMHKENVLFALDAVNICGKNSKYLHEINENSVFGRMHMRKSWYDKLFNYNKSELLIKLCKEQGYEIKIKSFEKDQTETTFIDVKEKIHQENIDQHARIHNNDVVKEKKTDIVSIENRERIIKDRLKKVMSDLNIPNGTNDEMLKAIIFDENKYNRCRKSSILYLTDDVLKSKEIQSYLANFSLLAKNDRLYPLLNSIKWMENQLCGRFEIANLKEKNVKMKKVVTRDKKNRKVIFYEPEIKYKLLAKIDDFRHLSSTTSCKSQTKEIEARINKITSADRLKKFFMDMINQFDDFYEYKRKQVRTGETRKYIYTNFKFCEERFVEHAKIINCLKMDREKFREPMKQLININIKNNYDIYPDLDE